MRLLIEAEVSQRRGGVAATSRQLHLAGHGDSREDALASLQGVAAAWVLGLSLAGTLDTALERCGVRQTEVADGQLLIDLQVI